MARCEPPTVPIHVGASSPNNVRNRAVIHLQAPTTPFATQVLHQPGGFAWWYADVLASDGTGLVVIAGFGLPFLPGIAAAARAGHPTAPVARPSLNVAYYQQGRCTFYLLQEYPQHQARYDSQGSAFWLGNSHGSSVVHQHQATFELTLDMPVPGTTDRLTGTISIAGNTVRLPDDAESTPPSSHLWRPLTTACQGSAALALGGQAWPHLCGRAYHDRNRSDRPLHELGIAHWIWGRTSLDQDELIHYLLWPTSGEAPTALLLRVDPSGHTRSLPVDRVTVHRPRRTLYGMTTFRQLVLHTPQGPVRVEPTHCIDNGPFYLRWINHVHLPDGARATGFGEAVNPHRIDRPWFTPLVRMATHQTSKANCRLLPLFSGPRAGRLGRTLRALWRGVPQLTGQSLS